MLPVSTVELIQSLVRCGVSGVCSKADYSITQIKLKKITKRAAKINQINVRNPMKGWEIDRGDQRVTT